MDKEGQSALCIIWTLFIISESNNDVCSVDDCRKFILNDASYKKKLAEHPFDQETYIERYIKNIMEWSVFRKDYSSYDKDTLFWFGVCDDYFIDAACNLVWREIAKEYTECVNDAGENVSESKNITDVVNMLCDYFVE